MTMALPNSNRSEMMESLFNQCCRLMDNPKRKTITNKKQQNMDNDTDNDRLLLPHQPLSPCHRSMWQWRFKRQLFKHNPPSQHNSHHNQASSSNNQVNFKCNLIVRDRQTPNDSLLWCTSPTVHPSSVRASLEWVGRWFLGRRCRVGSLEAACTRVFGVHVTGRPMTDAVPIGTGQRRQVGRVLVRWRLEASHAEAGHGRGEVEIGRDAKWPRVVVLDIKVISRQTRLYHRLQAVHKQLRIILVLRRLTISPILISSLVLVTNNNNNNTNCNY